MAKILPNSVNRENVASWKVFYKERNTYGQYIPEFEQMYKDAGKKISFGPRYYESQIELDDELIVLEDLVKRGFRNVDRQNGLDIQHTEATLEKLAQFHAASAVRFELKGSYPEEYNQNLCSVVDSLKELRENQLKAYIDAFPLYDASHLTNDVVRII